MRPPFRSALDGTEMTGVALNGKSAARYRAALSYRKRVRTYLTPATTVEPFTSM